MSEDNKENFFKKAFRDMKENAKLQHKVDKANFEAVKAESKANFEENRGKNVRKRVREEAKENWGYAKLSSSEKQQLEREKQEEKILEAQERKRLAEERIEKAKEDRNK